MGTRSIYLLDTQDRGGGELGLNQFLRLTGIARLDVGGADFSIQTDSRLEGVGHSKDGKQKKNFEDHCFGLHQRYATEDSKKGQ